MLEKGPPKQPPQTQTSFPAVPCPQYPQLTAEHFSTPPCPICGQLSDLWLKASAFPSLFPFAFSSPFPMVFIHLVQAVSGEAKVVDDLAADQMFLDDAFEDGRSARVVPGSLRIDESDGTVHANPETVGFGSIDQRFGPHQVQHFQPRFQELPGNQPVRARTTLRLGWVGTEEDVAAVGAQAE